jgi:IPT/TIG domain
VALIRYGPIVDDVAGSIGPTTFARSSGGRQARRKTVLVNPATESQLSARGILAENARQWQLLTTSQRTAWSSTSNLRPYTNRVGTQHVLPGYQFFQKLNTVALQHGVTFLANPPSNFLVPAMNNATVTATTSGPATTDLTATWNSGAAVDAPIQLQATPRYPIGFRPDHHRLDDILTIAAGTVPPISIAAAWQAVHGDLPTQQPWQCLFRFTPIGPDNAWKGCPINFPLGVGDDPSPIPQPPTITAIAPNNGPYTGRTWLTILGTNFWPVKEILFGQTACQRFRVHGPTKIAALTPPATAGVVEVTLESEWGCSAPNSQSTFLYTGLAATIDTLLRGSASITSSSIDTLLRSTSQQLTGSTVDTLLRSPSAELSGTIDTYLASAGPSLRQPIATATATSGSSATVSWPTATTAGDTLFVVLCGDTGAPFAIPTGWTQQVTANFGPFQQIQILRYYNAPSLSSQTFTLLSGTITQADTFAFDFAPGALTGATDQAQVDHGTSTAASTGTTSATSAAIEIVIGAMSVFLTASGTMSGLTGATGGAAQGASIAGWTITSATGAQAMSATVSTSATWNGCIATTD